MMLGFLLVVTATVAVCEPLKEDAEEIAAERYLKEFGYYDINPTGRKGRPADLGVDDGRYRLLDATKKFQQFVGLPVTGKIDSETKKAMQRPRCGNPDVRVMAKDATKYHWKKQQLTWSLESQPRGFTRGQTRRAIKEAFDVWSRVVPLDFTEVSPADTKADLKLTFARYTHGDPWPFDGPGRVLAHAMFPPDGRTHFDDDESWAYRDPKKLRQSWQYTDLLAVAIHELGHALGLGHSRDHDSIMAPFYKSVDMNSDYTAPDLNLNDIYQIQTLYGRRNGRRAETAPTTATSTSAPTVTTSTSRPSTTTRKPWRGNRSTYAPVVPGDRPAQSSCPSRITAATRALNGKVYVFQDGNAWEFDEERKRIGAKKSVAEIFPAGPKAVSAAVTNPRTHFTLIFESRQVWAYIWDQGKARFNLHPSFPKTLSQKIPFEPTAAFLWRDGNVVLINNNDFAIYDSNWNLPTMVESVEHYFQNFPHFVTGTVQQKNNLLLLFSNSKVLLYDMNRKKLLNEDSSIQKLFNC